MNEGFKYKKMICPKPDFTSEQPKAKKSIGKYIGRGAVVFFTLLFLVVYSVFALCHVIAKGPSETARNLAVQSALQASATKWVPGLFLDKKPLLKLKKQRTVLFRMFYHWTIISFRTMMPLGTMPQIRGQTRLTVCCTKRSAVLHIKRMCF